MRDERTSLSRVRIVVIGASRVGKSALIVRYLTRRFIGEYHSNTDLLYRQLVTLNGTYSVELEVIDVTGSNPDNFPTNQVQWADAVLLVYSVTDRSSFDYAKEILTTLRKPPPSGTTPVPGTVPTTTMPVAMLGNKTDLDHLRQVSMREGQSVSSANGASFFEASVADNSGELYRCIDRLLTDVRAPVRTRKFSVTKMFGSLIGGATNSTVSNRSGSVVACPRVPPPSRPPLAAAAP